MQASVHALSCRHTYLCAYVYAHLYEVARRLQGAQRRRCVSPRFSPGLACSFLFLRTSLLSLPLSTPRPSYLAPLQSASAAISSGGDGPHLAGKAMRLHLLDSPAKLGIHPPRALTHTSAVFAHVRHGRRVDHTCARVRTMTRIPRRILLPRNRYRSQVSVTSSWHANGSDL